MKTNLFEEFDELTPADWKKKIKDDLKAKTAKKKELESLVDKLEKDVV